MSFSNEALQLHSRQESNSKMQRDPEPIVKSSKGIIDTVCEMVGKIWPKSSAETTVTTVKPNPCFNDVMVDIDGMIVYDQPIEGDFVEVGFASRVRTKPRKPKPSLAEDIGAKKPPTSLMSITIPESPK